eukprot:4507712-Pyramimonas_sp.AAC.1
MQMTWEPILCQYRGSPQTPTWADFRAEYEAKLPPLSPCPEPSLSDAEVCAFLQARPSRKAGGLDGWATAETEALPPSILAVFAEALRSMQSTGQVPGKGEGIYPEGQRLLSVLSVWLYSWGGPDLPKARSRLGD